jgi:hypothetical protein
LQSPTRAFTTVALPESGNPDKPYRYLIGYAHRIGHGSLVLDTDVPICTLDMVKRLHDMLPGLTGTINPAVISMTLIAAPAGTLVQQVPISENHANPYRYVIGYAHSTGFSTFVADSDVPLCTEARINGTRRTIGSTSRQPGTNIALLSITLVAAPYTVAQ